MSDERDDVIVTARLDREDRDALRAYAAENERTLSAELRLAVRFYMQGKADPAATGRNPSGDGIQTKGV